ncbi:MAG: S-methyl-5-thioribose-1-phosphate isomerase [Candidatus Aureabacteria bacterium]|nr:S-methyl-5-thioribose-1-phosphate isomerase [Candidatus Auribacterota bacterium]
MPVKPIEWKNRKLNILDQTLLPQKTSYEQCKTVKDVFNAIKILKVRGAPLIGITASYGLLVALCEKGMKDTDNMLSIIKEAGKYLQSSRPTAVNLEWAVKRMIKKAESCDKNIDTEEFFSVLEKEANTIFSEDYAMSENIGKYGSELIKDGSTILTHCNAGGLATSGLGTALSPLYSAHEQGKNITVYADETRPLLQGARLTAYELANAGIKTILISDSMAGFVISQGKIDKVIVGADRIAANGDTANKIGTMSLSILCSHFNIPFYVAAPSSTFDLAIQSGRDIPIEERDSYELKTFAGTQTAPNEIDVYNPAFDVTDNSHITAFITDKGLIYPPFEENLKKVISDK